jgi:hypothetical protein
MNESNFLSSAESINFLIYSLVPPYIVPFLVNNVIIEPKFFSYLIIKFVFICALFSSAVSSPKDIASNAKMING